MDHDRSRVLGGGYLPFRELRDLPHIPLTEDGYYLLSVSRNLALGKGVTIDGVSLTNGFQPLFAFLCVPAFLFTGSDRYEALRFVLGLDGLFFLARACRSGSPAARTTGRAVLDDGTDCALLRHDGTLPPALQRPR